MIIADIQMPGMNGLELIKKMETEELCRYYLILSGYDKLLRYFRLLSPV